MTLGSEIRFSVVLTPLCNCCFQDESEGDNFEPGEGGEEDDEEIEDGDGKYSASDLSSYGYSIFALTKEAFQRTVPRGVEQLLCNPAISCATL